jgi:hypothetical protein
MLKRHLVFLLIIVLFTNCKKENERPQWDIEVLGPVLFATLGIGQLIGDSSIQTLADGAQILDLDTTFSNFTLDSLYQIADTTISTIVLFPPVPPQTITPGTPFLSNDNKIALGVGDLLLKQAIISSGKIRLEIKNTLKSKVDFTYIIPHAMKDGEPFKVTATVDSGSTTDPKYFSNEYDFSGYDLDLTGVNGNLFNTISYNVNAVSDSFGYDFIVNGNDTVVNLNTTLVDVIPSFVRGYLGQAETNEANERNVGIGSLVTGGLIELDSIQLNLDFINYIGADEQAYISSIKSKNNRTGTIVDLVAPSILNQYININRAVINPSLTDSLVPTHYHIQLDHTNSNIRELVENLPDKMDIDLSMNINPLGNVSGGNDFVFSDKLLNTRFQLKMPLRFAMDQLSLVDTVPFSITGATDYDPVGFTTLKLIAVNGFPFDLNLQLFMLDSTQTIVDSLFVPDYIASAPVNANYRATGTSRTEIFIPVDADRKQRLLSVQHVGIRMKFDTPDFPQLIQMYSDYRLDLKIIADGIYSIR